jgi:hypothetical protein
VRQVFLAIVLSVCACKVGGEYAQNTRTTADVDRGETNGRSFEFVSNKPEGDDWQIRIRDSSMSVGYGNEAKSENLKPVNLDQRETKKVWKLIDAMEIEKRKKGKKDEDEGYVMLRLREPGGEAGHDATVVFISRASEDDELLALAEYLRTLVGKYHKEKPNF